MVNIDTMHNLFTRLTLLQRILPALLAALTWSSCQDYYQQTGKVKQALQDEDVEGRKAYQTAWHEAMRKAPDPVLREQLEKLDRRLTSGLHYMDSIYGEVNFQDDHQPPDNSSYVQELFLHKGVGDSLYSILIEVNALARQTVERSGKVTLVDSLQKTVLPQSSAGGWKKDNFSLMSTMR